MVGRVAVNAYILHCASPNADALLKETLCSLIEGDYETEIKVVCNGIEVPWLADEDTIQLRRNEGVSRGYNSAFNHSMGARPDYVLLLNNDIRIGKEMVSHLVRTAEADPTIGIVSPVIYYYGTRRIWFRGGSFNPWTGVTRHEGIRKIGARPKLTETEYATGCCMLIRRRVIETVGFFDEAFSPAYCEDTDYSYRTRQAGFKIMVQPKAIMWHKVSQSTGILK